MDDWTGLVDDRDDWDGITSPAAADAVVEVRTTPDDPAGSPTWSPWKVLDTAEFNARGFEFRVRLTSADPSYNIQVSTLKVEVKEAA